MARHDAIRRGTAAQNGPPAFEAPVRQGGTLRGRLCRNPMSEQAGGPPAVNVPPVARKIPQVSTVHGDLRQDDYYWLREKDRPEVLEYLKAENAYTAAMMKPTE